MNYLRDFLTFWSLPDLIGTLLEDIPPCPEWLFIFACLLAGASLIVLM